MRSIVSTLTLCCALACAPLTSAQEKEAAPRKLVILGYEGTGAKLVEQVAKRIEAEYGLQTRVLSDSPKPDTKHVLDKRKRVLVPLAKSLGGDPA
jgi:hypothetical protein